MSFVKRASIEPDEIVAGAERRIVLSPADTSGPGEAGRVVIDRWTVPAGGKVDLQAPAGAISWIDMLAGSGDLAGHAVDGHSVVVLAAGATVRLVAAQVTELLFSSVPDAARFGEATETADLRVVDWSRQPVLQSEHDTRRRIYTLTEALFGITAVKGEMIFYPDGATCPEHHHEGAEHYQYVRVGSGTVVSAGVETQLHAGDLFYNLENEAHWFENTSGSDFVFTEYFVPGRCRTVWAPQTKVCAWLPTGGDAAGRKPARDIGRHVHGDGTPV